jgi:hypothetical protein
MLERTELFQGMKIISGLRARNLLLSRYPEDTLLNVALETDLLLAPDNFLHSERELRNFDEANSLLQVWTLNGRTLAIVFAVENEGGELRIRLLSISKMLRMEEMEMSILRSFLRLVADRCYREIYFPLYPDTREYYGHFEHELTESGWTSELTATGDEVVLRAV